MKAIIYLNLKIIIYNTINTNGITTHHLDTNPRIINQLNKQKQTIIC